VFTPTGAPADSLADAPEWWVELTPADDSVLLETVFDVGHGRIQKVAREDTEPEKETKEDFGWHSLITSLESRMRVEPASYYDRDLFQLMGWARALPDQGLDLDE
jgi:hypothetical protein